jgi:hypothetical protein
MSAIVVVAILALAVLVMALAGSHFARRALIFMVGLTATALVAIWLMLRNG